MTRNDLRALCFQASARIPHEPEAIAYALDSIRGMTYAERTKAARCYAAIVGERMLPANLGERE